jgi:flagellar hook-length control protein FliK
MSALADAPGETRSHAGLSGVSAPAYDLGLRDGAPATLSATPDPRPPAGPSVDVGEQIMQGLRLQWRTGTGEARIRLHPEHLGAVDVALKVSDGGVRALVRAEAANVQDWIVRHRDELKAALQAQGLVLEDLEVVVDPDDRRRHAPGEAEQPRPTRRRAAADDRLFEVRV